MTDITELHPFSYDPLPRSWCIRLLQPKGKDSHGTPCFLMQTYDLDQKEKVIYHCLSYTWGNPHANGVSSGAYYHAVDSEYGADNQFPILVNGKVLHIRKNLHDALVTLPGKASMPNTGSEDLFWADAICINQENIDEKSAQVSMMDRIFAEATFVLAWLGPEDKKLESGIETLTTLAKHRDNFNQSQIVPFGGFDKENYESASIPFISWEEWTSLAALYQRQWFRRAWIVQEAVLPERLIMYCGKHEILLSDLGEVAEALRRQEAKLGTTRSTTFVPYDQVAISVQWNMAEIFKYRKFLAGALKASPEQASEYRALFTLEELAMCFWTFSASDPRDKIFSLSGLMNVFSEERYQSDYRRSVESVYTSAVRKIMVDRGDLNSLSGCVYSAARLASLPSWVLDFSLPGMTPIPNLFSAEKGLRYRLPDFTLWDSPILRVRGIRLGFIGQTGNRQGVVLKEKFSFDPSWLKILLSLDLTREDDTKPVLSELLWKALCMNMSYGSFVDAAAFGPHAPEDFGEQFKLFILIMILAKADGMMLEELELEKGPADRSPTITNTDYDPFKLDLASTLDDLDIIEAHDLEQNCLPRRSDVLENWNNLQFTVARITKANNDGSPVEIYLPQEVFDGHARILGNGMIEPAAKLFQACREYGTAYSMAYGNRKLFALDKSHLGLAPLSAKQGDEVWILAGMSAPAILREADDEQQSDTTRAVEDELEDMSLNEMKRRYHFVGAAYVQGLMYGEGVEGKEETLEDIELV